VELSPLELATHVVFGEDPAPPLPAARGPADPLAALEKAMAGALERPGCLVSFSGGRDSSAVLAVAVRAARGRGLPDPVPVTVRFPGARGAGEDEWQETVVDRLGLADWERVEVHDELELLGDLDLRLLERHGLRYPANVHLLVPPLEAARGGTLLTGLDGDTVLGGWRWEWLASLAAGRARPAPRDLLRLGRALVPESVVPRRGDGAPAWLTGEARAELAAAGAAYRAAEPRRWDARVAWVARLRYLRLMRELADALAADAGARIEHPLLDRAFLGALGRAGGRFGFGDRAATLRALFSTVLPEATLARTSKATFTAPLWRERARAFARGWSGRGVDTAVVDSEALRAAWLSEWPDFRSAMLLKQAWLADRREQRAGGGRH
jgi:asparagine synthetase B (glutamine-hydrolysing)